MSDCLKPNFWNEARERKTPEKPASREAQAIALLHRVTELFHHLLELSHRDWVEEMARLLGDIEAFLTEIEAEENGL